MLCRSGSGASSSTSRAREKKTAAKGELAHGRRRAARGEHGEATYNHFIVTRVCYDLRRLPGRVSFRGFQSLLTGMGPHHLSRAEERRRFDAEAVGSRRVEKGCGQVNR